MKLYLLTREHGMTGYDYYDSVVVAAKDKDVAREIHPDGRSEVAETGPCDTWVRLRDVKATYLGRAKKGTKAGVICASFNAG